MALTDVWLTTERISFQKLCLCSREKLNISVFCFNPICIHTISKLPWWRYGGQLIELYSCRAAVWGGVCSRLGETVPFLGTMSLLLQERWFQRPKSGVSSRLKHEAEEPSLVQRGQKITWRTRYRWASQGKRTCLRTRRHQAEYVAFQTLSYLETRTCPWAYLQGRAGWGYILHKYTEKKKEIFLFLSIWPSHWFLF